MVDHNHTASEVRGTVEPQASIPAPKPAGIWFPLVPFVGSTSGQVRGTQGTRLRIEERHMHAGTLASARDDSSKKGSRSPPDRFNSLNQD